MNLVNIGDAVKVTKIGNASGCIGDGEIVVITAIQLMDGLFDGSGIFYSGTYQSSCGNTDSIQFTENEYTVISHKSN